MYLGLAFIGVIVVGIVLAFGISSLIKHFDKNKGE